MREDYAVVVGINHYPTIGSLKGAEQDALNFIEWLKDPHGGDVPEEQILKVLSSDFNPQSESPIYARPNIEDIHAKFDELGDLYIESDHTHRRVGRRLYLFFSGHGIGKYERGALLLANARNTGRLTHFPSSDAAMLITKSAAFDEVVLFMDCCRDKYRKNFVPLQDFIFLENPGKAEEIKYFYILASKWGQKAKEAPNPNAGGRYEGYFTRALMMSLREGIAGQNEITNEILLENLDKNLGSMVSSGADFNEALHDMKPNGESITFGKKSTNHQEKYIVVQINRDKFTDINTVEIEAPNTNSPIKTLSTETDNFTLNTDENVMEIKLPLASGFYKILLPETSESKLFEVSKTEIMNYVRID